MSTNVFFASSVLLMCSGLVRNRDNNFITGMMFIKKAPRQLPMEVFEPTSFLLQASAYTTGTLHQSTAQLLMAGTQSKEHIFFPVYVT
mmetsp:Transcript_61295/g.101295  ORF Transcript_61295/g.101295 Transcript_61295/m.101295 type:complete len:88 (+) Transcript_61295:619-882(+)